MSISLSKKRIRRKSIKIIGKNIVTYNLRINKDALGNGVILFYWRQNQINYEYLIRVAIDWFWST